MKITTHDGQFHADEVSAIAILKSLYPDAEIIRTRDTTLLEEADIVLDVGHKYDPSGKLYDHHQATFDLKRPNGTPYSSCGLVWLHYGHEVIKRIVPEAPDNLANAAYELLDQLFIQPIDAIDTGHNLPKYFDGNLHYSQVISSCNILKDSGFNTAVDLAKITFQLHLAKALELADDKIKLSRAIVESDYSSRFLVLPEYINFKPFPELVADYSYVFFPKDDGSWSINPTTEDFYLHPTLRGRSAKDINTILDIDDTVFVHKSGFTGAAKSLASAFKIAEY
jgi:uncharacterized UPF0160 family protein